MSDAHITSGYIFEILPTMQQPQQRNDGTIEFLDRVHDRCAAIATLPTSQHDAQIALLSKQTGLSLTTIAPIIERYAYLRLPDYPQLAARFIAKIGRDAVHTMLSTNFGRRELTRHVQTALTDERLRITGPRVSLFIDAIKAEFQGIDQQNYCYQYCANIYGGRL